MIVNFWPQWFRNLYGGEWPRSYCTVDIETSGYSFDQDIVTEWGHCYVEDGKIVDRLALVIDWTDRVDPPQHWLAERLRKVKQGMALSGKTYHIDLDVMKTGMKPEKAFQFIKQFTDKIRTKRIPFVAHNGFFDEKMLSANVLQHRFGTGYTFGDVYIDTSGIEKASQIPDNERVHPRKNETLREYFTRVQYTRVTGVKSNMDDHCFHKYKFTEKYGIRAEDLHGAGPDSYCCHLLMEEFRALVTEPQTPPIYPTADSKAARKAPKSVTTKPFDPNLKRMRGQRRS